jgi:hypothetical protein
MTPRVGMTSRLITGDYADGRGSGQPGRGGIAGFWGDVRAWIEARRGNAAPVYESDPDEPRPEPVG